MFALLRKDWRVNRAAVVGSLIFLAALYLLMLIMLHYEREDAPPAARHSVILQVGIMGLALSALMAAVYGGSAFALERRERTADFLAMLPVTRARSVASKMIVALGCLAMLWAVNLAVILSALYTWPNPEHSPEGRYWEWLPNVLLYIGASAALLFGLAWLLSTFLSSPAIAASVSIGASSILAILVASIAERLGYNGEIQFMWFVALVAGLACFVAGTMYHVRRVEP